jgi:hypothetical protein
MLIWDVASQELRKRSGENARAASKVPVGDQGFSWVAMNKE